MYHSMHIAHNDDSKFLVLSSYQFPPKHILCRWQHLFLVGWSSWNVSTVSASPFLHILNSFEAFIKGRSSLLVFMVNLASLAFVYIFSCLIFILSFYTFSLFLSLTLCNLCSNWPSCTHRGEKREATHLHLVLLLSQLTVFSFFLWSKFSIMLSESIAFAP